MDNELFNACASGDMIKIKSLLASNSQLINSKDKNGNTPLAIACSNVKAQVVKFLLDVGSDANTVNNDGWTPLHHACFKGDLSIAKNLVEKNANIYVKTKNGDTTFDIARQQKQVTIAEFLRSQHQAASSASNRMSLPQQQQQQQQLQATPQRLLQLYEVKGQETLQHVQTLKKENPQQALAIIEKLIEMLTVEAQSKLANANLDLKRLRGITADAYFTLAILHVESQKDELALQAFSNAFERNPLMYTALNWKGYLLTKLQRFDDALACFDQVIKSDPGNESAANYKRDLLKLMSRRAQAPQAPPAKSTPAPQAPQAKVQSSEAVVVVPLANAAASSSTSSSSSGDAIDAKAFKTLQQELIKLQEEHKRLQDTFASQVQTRVQEELVKLVSKFEQRFAALEKAQQALANGNPSAATVAPPPAPPAKQQGPVPQEVLDKLAAIEKRVEARDEEYRANYDMVKKALVQEKLDRDSLIRQVRQDCEASIATQTAKLQTSIATLECATKEQQQQEVIVPRIVLPPPVQQEQQPVPSIAQQVSPQAPLMQLPVSLNDLQDSISPRFELPSPRIEKVNPPSSLQKPSSVVAAAAAVEKRDLTSVALYDYQAKTNEEIDMKKGDILQVMAEEDDGWTRVELNGKRGLIPSGFISPPRKNFTIKSAVAIYDYTAQNEDEISFKEGETVQILYTQDDGWTLGQVRNQKGMFPTIYTELK